MSKSKNYYRYEVTHVYKGWEDRVKVGDVLIDIWRNKSHTYQFERNGEISVGFSVKLIGKVTEPETLAQLEAKHDPR